MSQLFVLGSQLLWKMTLIQKVLTQSSYPTFSTTVCHIDKVTCCSGEKYGMCGAGDVRKAYIMNV